MPPCLSAALALLALLPATLSAATQIHLAPSGNDADPGTAALPVRTPQAAQVRVRALIASGLTDSVEVVFAAGTYVMDAPLELRPEDSGTAVFPITWKAAAGATVSLSGGRQITTTWTNAGGGIWFTDVIGTGLGAGQWNFRELFVSGGRATRARFPNKSGINPFLYATGGSLAHAVVAPALVKPAWGTAADAQINVVPQSRFFNQWNTVTAVNTATGRIDIADSERHRIIDSGSWFWIEGVQAELDEPGEWFLDPATGRLHYMPQPGVDPNTLNIIAPFLNRTINAKGDVNANTHVRHVHFDGLEFRHTTFTLGHIEARVHTDAVIMFENTQDCSVRNCRLENIGGYALWLHLDSQRNVFDNNNVQHSGGGGVLITGARLAYMDDTKIYTPGAAAAKVAPILNEVTRNTVEHCGKVRYYGGGVHLDSRPFSMSMSPGNLIAHNHFNDLSRNGVFAFRNQGGNVVEYNRIHNAMQTTIDGGCIHFATMNHLSAPNFIRNNWLYDIWGYEQKPDGNVVRRLANGVFLDWDTSNTTVRDNWIYNSVGGSVKTIWENWNLVVANNMSSDAPITPPFSAEVGPGGTATNGVNLPANKLTGSVIHYTQTSNFSTTGTWTPETAVGIVGLFEFSFLAGTAAAPSQAVYTLPITEPGKYQISLLYKPGTDRASNVPITIAHAGGTADVTWNMREGSTHGFAVAVGEWRFAPGGTNTVTLSTAGTNGKVIADAVAFVKIDDTARAKFVRNLANGTAQRIVLYGTSLTAGGAWVGQMQGAVEAAYPGLATWVNSGGSGQASNWGVTNLQAKVINENPDAVFIEFSINDAAETLNVSRTQAVANLTTMVNGILAARPACEIILQIMNPVDHQPGDTFNVRANLALYQQDWRNFAAANGLRCIDHMPAFSALFEKGTTAYRAFVPDGVHPTAAGYSLFLTPTLLQALGVPIQSTGTPQTIIDNTSAVITGEWFTSSASPGFFGANYLQDGNLNKGTKTAVYTPNFPQAGTYPVFMRWAVDTNRATNVPVTVNYSGGSQVVTVNQRSSGGVWNKLGDFPFAAGTTGNVSIGTTGTNGFVVADAIGVGLIPAAAPEVRLRMDNARAAEPPGVGGARKSTITVWVPEPVATNLTVPLTYPAATALSGFDYQALPASITIPAGQSSASIDLIPLADTLGESDETFRVAAAPGGGYVLSSPIEATIVIESTSAALIAEAFSGAATALNGKTADAFSPLIASAGGSSAWIAATTFLQNGAASGGTGCAYLNLGTFIDSAKGTAQGKYQLSATLAPTTGSWLSFGFATQNLPSTLKSFTNTGTGTTTTGAATIIYRGQTGVASPNTNGELDMFGFSNQNPVDGPDGNTGTRSVTITLDLTPAGGYNGTTNFGTVTWADSVLGTIGTFTYPGTRDFGSIMISGANPFTGAISNLSLIQILPAVTFESWISGFGLAPADQPFDADPDRDGLPSGMEHVFGTNPNGFTQGLTEISASASSLTFRHPLNPTRATTVGYTYEWSADLTNWRTSGQLNASGTRAAFVPSPPDGNGQVTVVLTITAGPAVRLFTRMVALKNP
jgi:lysophospholipase L1-like esterase